MGKGDDPNCGAGASAAAMSITDDAHEAFRLRQLVDVGAATDAQRHDLAAAERRLGGRVFRVPSHQVADLRKLVEKAGKAALRMGAEPAMLRELDTVAEAAELGGGVKVARDFTYLVVANSDVLAGEGWRFVGSLIHDLRGDEPTSKLRQLPGTTEIDLSRFEGSDGRCDHCNLNRRRLDTFLVQGPDGEVRQVGRSCLNEYIGSDTPEKAAKHAELILGLVDKVDTATRSGGWGGGPVYSTGRGDHPRGWEKHWGDPEEVGTFESSQFLAFVASQARREGFITRRKEQEGAGRATATVARESLFKAMRGEDDVPLPEAGDHQYAKDALEFARERIAAKPPHMRSDYELRLSHVLSGDRVSPQDFAVLAPAIDGWRRELERREKAAHGPVSKHVGKPKERLDLRVTVERKFHGQSASGFDQVQYHLRDSEGNKLIWYSGASAEMQQGGTYELRGTVKRHETKRDEDRTVLTNCRFEEAQPAAA